MHILEKVSRTLRLIKETQRLNNPFPYQPSPRFLFPIDTQHLTINFAECCGHFSSTVIALFPLPWGITPFIYFYFLGWGGYTFLILSL